MTDMLEAQSQISFDDDNELFRQDTDAESEAEHELDHEEAEEEEKEGEHEDGVVKVVPGELSVSLSSKDTLKKPSMGKEAVLLIHPPKPQPRTEKRKPLTLIELPVDVLKEIVKEVGLRHLLSAPLQLRVRQLFYLSCLYPPRSITYGRV